MAMKTGEIRPAPNAVAAERERYAVRMPSTLRAHARTAPLVPGGVPGGLSCHPPGTPGLYLTRGEGCWIWDADDHRCLDLVAGDWTMVLGHGHPDVDEALRAQIAKGTNLGAPDPQLVFEVARLIQDRLPSMERMRFTTSGTEAVMFAMRVARAATGRRKIAKVRGAYHGTYDISLIANGKYIDPTYQVPGLIPGTSEVTVLLEYNDVGRSLEVLGTEADELAAVIVEPVHATNGMIPATVEYLRALRNETERLGILLIFDEIVTFSVDEHGAQGMYGVTPDLTTAGKTVGGGLPLGVFGGRADLMALVDPDNSVDSGGRFAVQNTAPVRHASTLAATALCLAASRATLSCLTPEVHAHLSDLGAFLRGGAAGIADDLGVPLQATGMGPLFALHWTPEPVVDIATATTSNRRLIHALNVFLFNAGYYVMANGLGMLTNPMTEGHVRGFLVDLRTIIEEGRVSGWIDDV